jgi:hypothetical protein
MFPLNVLVHVPIILRTSPSKTRRANTTSGTPASEENNLAGRIDAIFKVRVHALYVISSEFSSE